VAGELHFANINADNIIIWVAGAVLVLPFSDIAVDKGFTKRGDTTEVISSYQFNNININPVWAEKNRPSVVKFIKAIFKRCAGCISIVRKGLELRSGSNSSGGLF